MSKKITSGDGWKVIPANPEIIEEEVISKPKEQQRIKISLEKRNKGKFVTVLSGLVLSDSDTQDLAKVLKNLCGTGGTVDNRNIELQGELQEKVRSWLIGNNWRLK